MNKETYVVFAYYLRHPGFLEAIKELSLVDTVSYMKKNLTLDKYAELNEVQVKLFYAAMNNINWHEVISEIENETSIKGWIKK